MLSVAHFCAEESSHRFVLKSVHVIGSATSLRCESGNGYQFALFNSVSAICADFDILIPSTFASLVAGALAMKGAELMLSENMLTVSHSSGSYTCKLADGKFPDTGIATSSRKSTIGMISGDEWVQSFKCIKMIRDHGEDILVRSSVVFGEKECVISNSGNVPYSQTIDGKFNACDISINALSFLKCLSAFDGKSTLKLDVLTSFNGVMVSNGDLCVMDSQLVKEAS